MTDHRHETVEAVLRGHHGSSWERVRGWLLRSSRIDEAGLASCTEALGLGAWGDVLPRAREAFLTSRFLAESASGHLASLYVGPHRDGFVVGEGVPPEAALDPMDPVLNPGGASLDERDLRWLEELTDVVRAQLRVVAEEAVTELRTAIEVECARQWIVHYPAALALEPSGPASDAVDGSLEAFRYFDGIVLDGWRVELVVEALRHPSLALLVDELRSLKRDWLVQVREYTASRQPDDSES